MRKTRSFGLVLAVFFTLIGTAQAEVMCEPAIGSSLVCVGDAECFLTPPSLPSQGYPRVVFIQPGANCPAGYSGPLLPLTDSEICSAAWTGAFEKAKVSCSEGCTWDPGYEAKADTQKVNSECCAGFARVQCF